MTARRLIQQGRVAVVTVAYRSDGVLGNLLASLRGAASTPADVVIVDNLPAEGEGARRLAEHHGAAYIPCSQNLGYGGAMNVGVATLAPTVEWVLLCNPDLELTPTSVDTMLTVADADATIGSVGPSLLNADLSTYSSARRVPSLRTGIGHALFANLWQENPWTASYRQDGEVAAQRDAGWLSGACLLVRRSAFDSVGGFDEEFFMYFEDVDLGHRLGLAGWRNVYVPEAKAVHLGAHSTTTDSVLMIRAHHSSARRFLKRKYSRRGFFWLRWSLWAALLIREEWVVRRAR
jgi:N-acetylglucosaminyl-diphospho-decaprenol L-rhamnosyltransferase